jgi:hypothetical protein
LFKDDPAQSNTPSSARELLEWVLVLFGGVGMPEVATDFFADQLIPGQTGMTK